MSDAALNAALAKAQGEFPTITKDQTASTGAYSYSYANLAAFLSACRPVLSKNGLAILQLLEDSGQDPALRTELRHAEGGVISSAVTIPNGRDLSPQQFGSAITYYRRYALAAMLGVAAEEDDDDASQAQAAKTKRRKRSEPPPLTDPDVPFSDHVDPDEVAKDRASEYQKRTLNMLVSSLRRQGHITTDQVWLRIALARGQELDDLILKLGGIGDDGILHWSPLRDALTYAEAETLMTRLQAFKGRVEINEAAAALRTPPADDEPAP